MAGPKKKMTPLGEERSGLRSKLIYSTSQPEVGARFLEEARYKEKMHGRGESATSNKKVDRYNSSVQRANASSDAARANASETESRKRDVNRQLRSGVLVSPGQRWGSEHPVVAQNKGSYLGVRGGRGTMGAAELPGVEMDTVETSARRKAAKKMADSLSKKRGVAK